MENKVSIIVPVYNGEKYLRGTIEMIINQTFKEFELILIDDGSNDNSKEICNYYANADKRIRVIRQQNLGAWAARNAGIKSATGKYIMFLDCDDWYEKNLIEVMYNAIESSNVDLVICGHIDLFVNSNRKIYKSNNIMLKEHVYESNESFMLDYYKFRKIGISDVLWNKIYRAEIIKENELFFQKLPRGEDAVFNINYYEKINSCRILENSLYKYRIEREKPSWIKYSDNFYEALLIESEIITNKIKRMKKYNKDIKAVQAEHFVLSVIEYFNWIIYPKNNFTLKKQINKINEVINKEHFIKSLNEVNINEKFNKLLIELIKSKKIKKMIFLIKIKYRLRELYHSILCIISRKYVE